MRVGPLLGSMAKTASKLALTRGMGTSHSTLGSFGRERFCCQL